MKGATRAIIVGCSVYESPQIPDLLFGEADAAALCDRLTNPEVGGCDPSGVELLCSPMADPLRRALERLLGAAKPDDRVVLYFAGHGLRDNAGRLHLALRDTDPDVVRSTGIEAQLLREMLNECRSKHICLILDCCFGGAIDGARSAGALDPADVQRSVNTLCGQGTVILTSAHDSQQARERQDYGHGVFTYHMLEGLDGAADGDADGFITPDELYRYISARMEQEPGPRQTPTFTGSLVGGIFPLARNARRRSKALAKALDEIQALRDQRLHLAALDRLRQLQTGPGAGEQAVEETRRTVQQEIDELVAEFRNRVFEDAKAGLLESHVLSRIDAWLKRSPERLFVEDPVHNRHSLLRNYFMKQIHPRALLRYWGTDDEDSEEHVGASEDPQLRPPLPTPPPPPRVRVPWARLILATALVATLGVGTWLAWPTVARVFKAHPAFDSRALRMGILLKREWGQPDNARTTFRIVLEKLNQRLNGSGFQFRTDVEAFSTIDEVLNHFRNRQIDLVGELSPYDIYRANLEVEAQPFVSPMYGGLSTYNAWFLMSSLSPCLADKSTCWGALTQSLLARKGRLAYTDESSTSGYWVPRGEILKAVGNAATPAAFSELSLKVGADEFLESIACGGGNVLAGVIPEFRVSRAEAETFICGGKSANVVRVLKTPTIRNGGFALSQTLAADRTLVSALQQAWEAAVQTANAETPIQLEPSWTTVEMANYAAERNTFTLADPAAANRSHRQKLVLVACALLIVVTSVAYLWVHRRHRHPAAAP